MVTIENVPKQAALDANEERCRVGAGHGQPRSCEMRVDVIFARSTGCSPVGRRAQADMQIQYVQCILLVIPPPVLCLDKI